MTAFLSKSRILDGAEVLSKIIRVQRSRTIFDSYAHNMAVYPIIDLGSTYERVVHLRVELMFHHGEPFTMPKSATQGK